jgi:hypothetical protein
MAVGVGVGIAGCVSAFTFSSASVEGEHPATNINTINIKIYFTLPS